MSQSDELKRLADELIAANDLFNDSPQDNEIGDAWSVANDRFTEAASPETVKSLIAENERLLNLLERTVEQHVPLTELEGVPGWSRVVELVEVVTERDQLRAEIAGLKTGYEAYERVNAELKAECSALRESNDKLTRRNGMLEQNVEAMTETHALYTWLRKKCDQPSNDVVAVHMNIGHDWATVHDLDADLRAMIDREEP